MTEHGGDCNSGARMQKVEQSSCTEDRIQHLLERCLCDLGVDAPDKQLWSTGLCMNRWCLEELVRRDPHNFVILLHKILQKAREVLQQCRYHLVVPLTLLFSSALLKAPHVAADVAVLQEAYLLFRSFLTWPEPCFSASKRLLTVIQQELRAPGISFQRLVRAEQEVLPDLHCSKVIVLLLVSPDEDVLPEVQSLSEQLRSSQSSSGDVTLQLLLRCFHSVLGSRGHLGDLHAALQAKQPEELQEVMKEVTDMMETAASTENLGTARETLVNGMERLREDLTASAAAPPHHSPGPTVETAAVLPFPKCLTCSWDNDTFDFLNDIVLAQSDLDSPADCFVGAEMDEDDNNDTSVDEEDEGMEQKSDNRISTASSSSRDSNYSLSSSWSLDSTPSCSSGVESDFREEGLDSQPKPRKKPKKKSRSLLGVERFSLLFKTPLSPRICRRVQSMGYCGDLGKDSNRANLRPHAGSANPRPLSPQKHLCIRRRPILSCDEDSTSQLPTQVKVVVFGGDREAGRLARAYRDLQQKESKYPRLTKTCRLQFYLVPTRRTSRELGVGGAGGGGGGGGVSVAEGQTGSSSRVSGESSGTKESHTSDIAQMLGVIDPWYERNVLNLLSLSPEVLCQAVSHDVSSGSGSPGRLPLLTDLVLYYCRHADQPVLLQLYQAELTLAGGERKREVFLHSLELGHTAGTRAVKAMGAASKRFGIDEEREAVPLTFRVAYNKVAVSRRSQWNQVDMVCTSINLHKACQKATQLGIESLQLSMTEVLKRQCSRSKKGYNQHFSISEVRVDQVQVTCLDEGTTFAVCLDQDEKKFIHSVVRCDVSLCCKPGAASSWSSYKTSPGQVQPLHPSYCSLLCLPVTSFSTSSP